MLPSSSVDVNDRDALEELPERMSAVETQVAQLRDEMRAGHEELRAEMRALNDEARLETRALHHEAMAQTRMLHEEVLGRIATIAEGHRRRK